MKEASHYIKVDEQLVECKLCPFSCRLSNEQVGICGSRKNEGGRLIAKNYGLLSAIAIDPVEKKPLYHFYPSSQIFSIGSYGCTMKCKMCQNSDISQCNYQVYSARKDEFNSIEVIRGKIRKSNTNLVAFTYNEPVVFYEFMFELSEKLFSDGIESAMISNGFIRSEPMTRLLKYISAFNIDLKSFNDNFYRKITGASMDPVLHTLEQIKDADKHLEITFLVIPELNDDPQDFKNMIDYIYSKLGADQVLHISRYFPKYKLGVPPTPVDTIKTLVNIAKEKLNYVYGGNINDIIDPSTYCPECSELLIKRTYYESQIIGIKEGSCKFCGHEIAGKFN